MGPEEDTSGLPDPLLGIVGPTASGKGVIGRAVARRIGGEIVSLDSMKLYRGMDIGTATPPLADREGVVHHLFDLVEPHEPYSVSRYLADAAAACRGIEQRGAVPLFVGGTPLYLQSLREGLFSAPAPDPVIRAALAQRAEAGGLAALHAELREVDPVSAARIHPNDQRRVIRALEFFQTAGEPISQAQTQWGAGESRTMRLVGLRWPRAELVRRIDRRVERMFASGLSDEVQRIRGAGGFGAVARQALGYKELLEADSPEAAQEQIRYRTRRLAKRQMSWFRRFHEIHWIDISSMEQVEQGVDEAVGVLTA